MKISTKLLCAGFIALFSHQVLASKHQSQTICPPIEDVAKVSFTAAMPTQDSFWVMVSDIFNADGIDWNVVFGAKIPEANTPEEALEIGQTFYKNDVLLNDPMDATTDDMSICIYGFAEDYLVASVSPPIAAPDGGLRLVKKFK